MATQDKLREYLKRVTVDLGEARRRIAEITGDRNEPVAVIGMACRYPGGDTPEHFWELLRGGRAEVTEVPASRWNIDDYYNPDRRAAGGVYTRLGAFVDDIAGWDAEFFGVPPGEAARMDPNQRLLMELAWEGMENVGLAPAQLAGSRTAVMVGLMDTVQYGRLEVERHGPGVAADPYFGQGISTSVMAGRLAYHFDLRGPAVTVDTACSSSLVGLHLALQALRGGECDLALSAGSYLILQPDTYVQGCATSMLAPDGRCKTFDAGADGYVMGEGGGLVVLERLSDALRNNRRIRAVIRGSAVNQDGRSNGLTAPSRSAQVDVIRQALAVAKVDPADVDYVEAHGSGTKLGDAIELSALHDVFGGRGPERPLHVGAVKTNIGHTQSAAGVAGLIKAVLALENGLVPPTLNLAEPTEALPFDATIRPATEMVPLTAEGRKPIAGVSSFGWSGTNAHLVLEAAPDVLPGPERQPDGRTGAVEAFTLPVSAASEAALSQQLRRLSGWLTERPALALADVAHTLTLGRAEHDYRCALTVTDRADAVRQLSSAAEAAAASTQRASKRPQVVFLLPGIGDHYAGLGQDLYRSEPVYAESVDRCLAIAQSRCGIDLGPLFFPADGPQASDFAAMCRGEAAPADPLQRAEIAHPFQFTVEYALAALLASWGVTPDLLVGYSLGEYVAACLAGVFTLEDALHVVAERARLIATVPRGRMLAVAADEDTVRAAIAAEVADVDIAAFNGPSMTVLSGVAGEIEAMARRLSQDGIACRPLRTAHAFHSALLEPVRDKLVSLIGSVPRSAPAIPIVSNHTGGALTAEQAAGGGYWGEHLTGSVRFRDSIAYCLDQGADVFVELGAGQTLGSLVRQNLAGALLAGPESQPFGRSRVLGTLPSAWAGGDLPDARSELLASCARLWEAGVAVNWAATQPSGRVVTLPGYPFQRTTFWPEPSPAVCSPAGSARLAAPVPGIAQAGPADTPGEPADRCYVATWRQDVARPSAAPLDLPGPLLVFTDTESIDSAGMTIGGIGTALADQAEAAGTPVVEVIAGSTGTEPERDGRRIVIDPAQPAHYREIIAALGEAPGPVHIVHLWSLLADTPVQASDEQLRTALATGFDTLLLTVQALGDVPAKQGVRLITVSRGAMEVLGGDATAPARAAAHGLARVVQHEFPGLTWRGVDLDEGTPAADEPAQLAVELTRDPDPYPVVAAWRRARRWVPEWAEVPGAAQQSSPGPVWRADGTYLITGGTRGLGMALARHLAAAGVRKLALVSRTPLRDRPVDDPKIARSLSDVAELEAAGAQVLLLAADVGVPGELRAALRAAREHFGALDGIVHAAGVPAGGMVARRTPAQAATVLAPKVLALGPLAELTGPDSPPDERPELLVLYSSAITAFGGIGEADYCAANTVVDAYGAALAATAPSTRVITVSWGPWQHDDWQAEGLAGAGTAGDGLAGRVREHREKYGFADDAGCAFLDRLVATGFGSVLAVRQPVQDSLREWSSILDIGALVSAVSARPAGRRFPRPRLRTEFVAPRTDRERVIAEIWGSLLGIDEVGVHDPFFELGGNSLVGLAVVHATESEFDTVIAPATLFGHPTVAEFAEVLASPDATAGTAQDLLNASTDRGSRRRGARSAKRR